MLNLKEFESNVYKTVTTELNLLAKEASTVGKKQKLLNDVLNVLHGITQETIAQITFGIMMDALDIKVKCDKDVSQ